MAKKTVQERVQRYLNSGGVSCPFCGYDDVSGSSWDMDGGSVSQEIFCLKCERSWVDIYSLSSVAYYGRGKRWIEIERKMGG